MNLLRHAYSHTESYKHVRTPQVRALTCMLFLYTCLSVYFFSVLRTHFFPISNTSYSSFYNPFYFCYAFLFEIFEIFIKTFSQILTFSLSKELLNFPTFYFHTLSSILIQEPLFLFHFKF